MVRLLHGVRDEPVGGGHDLGLPGDAARGLALVAARERGVLGLPQRVHGLDERRRPLPAGRDADLAGQPVVRVDQVVREAAALGPGAQDLFGEPADRPG